MNSEEELQNLVEQGKIDADDGDNIAYQHVFRALNQEPSYSVPAAFADSILLAIEKKDKQSNFADHLWLIVGLVAMVAIFGVVVFKFDLSFQLTTHWSFLKRLQPLKGIFIFAILFVGLLHFIDRQFIRPRASRGGIKKAIPVF